ncbi:MAG TPA: energy transducer TonB [Chthoniobacterales bacterium]|nr:energy transducer TonB [Chthoniobacterales bacterium]
MCTARFAWIVATILFGSLAAPFGADGESLPDMRPALVGSGRGSLVNLIDTQALIKRGQQHGAVLFRCLVQPSGQTAYQIAYGGTPNSDVLRLEVRHKLHDAYFIPAVYNHHNTFAWFYGTVTFSVIDGKPHLRVYANQEKSELAQGSDFITPQSIYVTGHVYNRVPRMKYPFGSWATEDVPGTVEFELTVSTNGQLKEIHIVQENPPGKGYGQNALGDLKEFTWLPAYKNGRPVEMPTHLTFTFLPPDWYWKP